jgi:hypothetical protein
MAGVTACAFYAYYVDSKRPDDDPEKKNYHPLAILFAPITFPILAVLSISLFLLRVLTYGIFVIFFVIAFIFLRKSSTLVQLQKSATGIGDRLMDANSFLVRFFLSPWTNTRGST